MAFTFGTLDLDGDTTPTSVTGSVSFNFGGIDALGVGGTTGLTLTATVGRPMVAVFDTDGTKLANLPLAAGISWQDELSAPGALSCRLPLDDAGTDLVTAKRILKVFWRGKARQAARVDSAGVEVAVDGRKWIQFDALPGALAMWGDVAVYPEFGVDRTASGQRTFGWMSTQHASWFDVENWAYPADPVLYDDDEGFRKGKPPGLKAVPPTYWIALRGPYNGEAAGHTQYMRRRFYTFDDDMPVRILVTGDDLFELWFDGEMLHQSDPLERRAWRRLTEVTLTVPAGRHLIAAKVRNSKHSAGPVGFIAVMQHLKENGDPAKGSAIVRTSDRWLTSDSQQGFKAADVIIKLLREARVRADDAGQDFQGANLTPLGFDYDRDTAGVAWDDDPDDHQIDLGSSLLDVFLRFCETHFDGACDPQTLEVRAWNRKGSDKSGTVEFDLGENDGNLISHSVGRQDATANTALMQLENGEWVESQDTGSVASFGRIETGLTLGSVRNQTQADRVAAGQFTETARAAYTLTTKMSTLDGPQLYRDFTVGDTVSVPQQDGTGHMRARVMAVTVDASSEVVTVEPELAWDPS